MINYKKYISEAIKEISVDFDVELGIPPKEEMGDYAIPCFTINIENIKNPHEKALYIKEKLSFDNKIISDVKVEGPYLNFTLNKETLAEETLKVISAMGNNYGSSNMGLGKKMLIEHTSINPNASPHIGRARNSIIGDFLVRLYKFEGYDVETNYFINDIGKQISMLLVGVEMLGNLENMTFSDMLNLYVEINEKSKKDPEIEKKVFHYLKELENGNSDVRDKFKKMTDVCVDGQQKIFNKMDIKWDKFTHESDFVFNNITDKVLFNLKQSGKLKTDEHNRFYVDLSGYNIPTKSPVLVLTREDGTSLYPLRDIAYTISKIESNSENNLIVLGEDQEVYMKQISAVLDILGYNSPQLISYSFVLLNGDKMATREGKVVLLEELIEEAKRKIAEGFKERNSKIDEEKISILAASCIKYNMLNINRKRNVNFNINDATNFQGNSAIYLLYNYVRINSILEKTSKIEQLPETIKLKEEIEFSLIKHLYEFPEIIDNSVETHESVGLANYLYNVSHKFSKFYEKVSVLNESDEMVRKSRIMLLNCTKTVLENGINILGIKPIKKL